MGRGARRELGLLTAAFPDTPRAGRGWAAANGFETLEIACWPARAASGGATRASPTSTSTPLRRRARCAPSSSSTSSRSPRSPTTRTGCTPISRPAEAARAPGAGRHAPQGSACGRSARSSATTRTGRTRRTQRFMKMWPRARRIRRATAACKDRHRELPDDLQPGRVARRPQPACYARDLATRCSTIDGDTSVSTSTRRTWSGR